jgi:integrase
MRSGAWRGSIAELGRDADHNADRSTWTLPRAGAVRVTGDVLVPYVLIAPSGEVFEPASEFSRELMARDHSPLTVRSYLFDLLQWLRFLSLAGVDWDRAGRTELRDLVLLLRGAENPQRRRLPGSPAAGSVNARTGKRYLPAGYASSSINHLQSSVKAFYEFQMDCGNGPLVNPVPATSRLMAHRNPMEPAPLHQRAAYRQRQPTLLPKAVPDAVFEDLFNALTCDRDRALLGMAVSGGIRASELLSINIEDVDWSNGGVHVISKGVRQREWTPVSADSLLWTAFYLGQLPRRPTSAPLWATIAKPHTPLNYMALRAVLRRANARLGLNVTLHDLRHTCAMRMADDPNLTLLDIQTVMRHRTVASTQKYLRPQIAEVVRRLRAHQERSPSQHPAARTDSLAPNGGRQNSGPSSPAVAPGYDADVLNELFRDVR